MKIQSLLLLGAVSVSFFIESRGQTTTAPSKFESEQDGFKIAFVGKPDRTESVEDSWFGKSNVIAYTDRSADIILRLVITDYLYVSTDEKELNRRFALMKEGELKQWGGTFTREVRSNFDGHPGREMVMEGATVTLSTRAVFIGKRVVYMTVFTKGKLSAMDERSKAKTQKLFTDFFASFEFVKSK